MKTKKMKTKKTLLLLVVSLVLLLACLAQATLASAVASGDTRLPVQNTGHIYEVTYNGNPIDLSALDRPTPTAEGLFTLMYSNEGTRTYTIEAGGTGVGSIAADNKTLTVEKAGLFIINLETSGTNLVQPSATPATGWLTVKKAAGAALSGVPMAQDKTHTAIALAPFAAPANGQSIEYAISTTPVPGLWQDQSRFDRLAESTDFYVFARSKGNDLYEAGNPVSNVITTRPLPPLHTNSLFTCNLAAKIYNGQAQGVTVAPKEGAGKVAAVYYTGTGKTKYDKSLLAPINAGTYEVTIDVDETDEYRYGAVQNLSLGTYAINAADLSKVEVSVPNATWTGQMILPKTFSYAGQDYLISAEVILKSFGANKNIGKGTITLAGKGNFTGEKKLTFKILPKKTRVLKIEVAKKQMKVTWKKVSAAQKVTTYVVRYRTKGSVNWKSVTCKASASSTTIAALLKGKSYEVQVRSGKKVSGATYYSAWSTVLLSDKIK